MTDLPDEAVEAAARALCTITSDYESGRYCETHGTEVYVVGLYYCKTGEDDARAALTAAAPHIAAQATVDLRAGIEALRDEWRARAASLRAVDSYAATLCDEHADALDALLREGE